MIHTRLGGLEIDKQKWVELLPSVLKKYNNTKHSTTGMTPHMAKQSSNHVEVWLNIHNKANFNRKYPPLKVGNYVRVYIKPKSFKKGYESAWSKDVYKVVFGRGSAPRSPGAILVRCGCGARCARPAVRAGLLELLASK